MQEDLELKYQFESFGDLNTCTFDSPTLLRICYSQRSSVELRRTDGTSTFPDHDAPTMSLPPSIQTYAVQQSQMSRSTPSSPRPRSMPSPQILKHDQNFRPAVQISMQARSASLPPPNPQDYSRIGTRQPPSVILPSSAQTDLLPDLERLDPDLRGTSHFDDAFRSPCINASSDQVTYATSSPFYSDSWNINSPDCALMPPRPPDSASPSFSSMVDYSHCTTTPGCVLRSSWLCSSGLTTQDTASVAA